MFIGLLSFAGVLSLGAVDRVPVPSQGAGNVGPMLFPPSGVTWAQCRFRLQESQPSWETK